MRKYYKEPLLHFLVIGVFIFGVFALVNNEEDRLDDNRITVSAADIERLSNGWSKKWNREPTETELRGLVDALIREEVYYREALALGLDNKYTIIRRRLMQKMEFLSNDLAELSTPDEDMLKKYLQEHKDRYEVPARLTFTHIYFSPDKRGAGVVEDTKNVLSGLDVLRAPERGDNFMMEYDFVQETPLEVERLFGKSFAEELFKSEIKSWQGPISSGYGFHLVRISEKIDSRMPEFDSVVEKVRTDWSFEHRQKINKEIYERFKEKYKIEVEKMLKKTTTASAVTL